MAEAEGIKRTVDNSHNLYIDFLRGVSIILVLVLHFNLAYHLRHSFLGTILPNVVLDGLYNGNYGVVMFFVISGFLITSRSLDRYGSLSKINIRNFYVMRFARIFPSMILVLLLVVLLAQTPLTIFQNSAKANVSMFTTVLSVVTCWHNILMQSAGYFNYCINILWSLSVEEVFYFAFPLICIFFKKTQFIIPIWIALIIWAPIYRHLHADDEIISLYGYWSCFDGIALGCISAVLVKRFRFQGTLAKLAALLAGMVMVFVYFYEGINANVVFGISIMSICTAVLLIVTYHKKPIRLVSNRLAGIVCWFGRKSYELYLFHIIILALMRSWLSRDQLPDHTKLVWLLVFFSASALVAYVISRFYSEPLNKKIRKSLILNK